MQRQCEGRRKVEVGTLAWRELEIEKYVQRMSSCEHLVHELRAVSSGWLCVACGAWTAHGLSKLVRVCKGAPDSRGEAVLQCVRNGGDPAHVNQSAVGRKRQRERLSGQAVLSGV
eukprot:3991090-Alexandrium_andersonii.AAC.1